MNEASMEQMKTGLQGLASNASENLLNYSQLYGSGDINRDIAVCLLITSAFLLLLLLRTMGRSRVETVYVNQEEDGKFHLTVAELRNDVKTLVEEIKGLKGFVHQELHDIRELVETEASLSSLPQGEPTDQIIERNLLR